ncbi:MAG: hypothetical protein HY962_01685 [Ignavibacteriae bacterium]|nr:hypothetical protein [Ignavibacteriota bacterium]
MQYHQKAVIVPMFLFVLVFAVGCKDASNPSASKMADPITAGFMTVFPSDNAVDVPADVPITMIFTTAVDRDAVERNFHLVSERMMPDSMCGMRGDMPHGSMNGGMMDTLMQGHTMAKGAMTGTFRWSANGTRCDFIPDSLMTSETAYYIHMDADMVAMMREKMGDVGMHQGGGMMNHGSMNGGMMLRFRTGRGTSQGSGGHEAHHP